MSAPPSGTVTFLFTDIAGSTRSWESTPDAMSAALDRHNEILAGAIRRHGGHIFKTVGDAFCSAFSNAGQAVAAAIDGQRALAAEEWGAMPMSVRMAIHTGNAESKGGDYFGIDLSLVGRLASAGYGGQVLLSSTSAALVRDHLPPGVSLVDLREHRLRDISRPERVHMLAAPGLAGDFPPLPSLATTPTNIVPPLTSLVGRDEEIAAVAQSLRGGRRLVTLVGPGGVGKTRVAIETALGLWDHFFDGVWVADISPISAEELLPAAVASVFQLRDARPGDEIRVLGRQLAGQKVLLVLDNCEHLREGCARLAAEALAAAPGLSLLATSREALGIAGESVIGLAPLGLPGPAEAVALDAMESFPALRLFRERGALVRSGFEFTEANAAAALSICRGLDALPLAIELAASRLSSMTVEQVATRVAGSLVGLQKDDPTRPPRQQTLRALVDWSSELLNERQRALFLDLSVFAGSWSPEGAAAICGEPGETEDEMVDRLGELVEKSLVVFEERNGTARYRYLDTIRRYAQEALDAGGRRSLLELKRCDWCVQLAIEAESHLRGPEQVAWLGRLNLEMPNFRGALTWCIDTDPARGMELAGHLFRYWWVYGLLAEGRRWLDALVLAGDGAATSSRALVLYGAGVLAHGQGDYEAAEARFKGAIEIYRELGDGDGEADALSGLANVAWRRGDYQGALAKHKRALAMYRTSGDRNRIASSLNNLGLALADRGDHAAARAFYEESLAIRRELGDQLGILTALHNLGIVAAQEGDWERALDSQRAAVESGRRLGDRRAVASALIEIGAVSIRLRKPSEALRAYGEALDLSEEHGDAVRTAQAVEGLAMVAIDGRQWEPAALLTGAAAAQRRRLGMPMTAAETAFTGERLAALARALGNERLQELQRRGAELAGIRGVAGRLQEALRAHEQSRATGPLGDGELLKLTSREGEILGLVALGLTNQEIAERLVVSVRTVETHLGNVYAKIGARGRADAVAFAVRAGLAVPRTGGGTG